MAGVVAAIFFYVIQTNTVTTSGFTVSQLTTQITALQADNRQLDVAVAEAQSIARLTTTVANQGYVPVDHIEYATIGSAVVAKR
jgi:ATP/ADP translocase